MSRFCCSRDVSDCSRIICACNENFNHRKLFFIGGIDVSVCNEDVLTCNGVFFYFCPDISTFSVDIFTCEDNFSASSDCLLVAVDSCLLVTFSPIMFFYIYMYIHRHFLHLAITFPLVLITLLL